MKIHDTEIEIIKKYVVKNKQERILWELSNAAKRERVVFTRFPGSILFKEDCLRPVEYMTDTEIETRLLELGGTREVYWMGESYIGPLTLGEAVRRVFDGEIGILYCGNGIGYYQGEEDYGGRPRYLLIAKA